MQQFLNLIQKLIERVTKQQLFIIVSLVISTSVANTLVPISLKHFIDDMGNQPSLSALGISLVLFIAPWISSRITSDLRWHFYGKFEQRIIKQFVIKSFQGAQKLGYSEINTRGTGNVSQIITHGQTGIQNVLFNGLVLIIPYFLEFAIVVAASVYLAGWLVGLTIGITIIGYVFGMVQGSKFMRVYQQEAMKAQRKSNKQIVDSLINHEFVKSFDLTSLLTRNLTGSLDKYESGWKSFYSLRTKYNLRISLWTITGISIVLSISTWNVAHSQLSVGTFVALITYVFQLLRPLDGLNNAYRELRRGLVYLEPAYELVDLNGKDNKTVELTSEPIKSIAFIGVNYSYTSTETLLKELTFEIPIGYKTAIVGTSGSGKSTILKLLMGLVSPSSGEILFNGDKDIEKSLSKYKQKLGFVSQNTSLFNESLKFNITLGNDHLSETHLSDVIELAGLSQYISSLPDGYGTVVGEGGHKVSGGERQRIHIARALYQVPEVLILDEATSSLDAATQNLVIRNIESITSIRTIVAVAHKLSSIEYYDHIIVVRNGEIVAKGTHSNLLAESADYLSLWNEYKKESHQSRLLSEVTYG